MFVQNFSTTTHDTQNQKNATTPGIDGLKSQLHDHYSCTVCSEKLKPYTILAPYCRDCAKNALASACTTGRQVLGQELQGIFVTWVQGNYAGIQTMDDLKPAAGQPGYLPWNLPDGRVYSWDMVDQTSTLWQQMNRDQEGTYYDPKKIFEYAATFQAEFLEECLRQRGRGADSVDESGGESKHAWGKLRVDRIKVAQQDVYGRLLGLVRTHLRVVTDRIRPFLGRAIYTELLDQHGTRCKDIRKYARKHIFVFMFIFHFCKDHLRGWLGIHTHHLLCLDTYPAHD